MVVGGWMDCIHSMPKSCVGVTIVESKILENVVAIGTVPFAFRCLVSSMVGSWAQMKERTVSCLLSEPSVRS